MTTPTAGPTCARSRFSPLQRFSFFFAVLFALKIALQHSLLTPTLQVVTLVAATTALVWFMWSAPGSRRGPAIVTAALWIATLAKLALR